jgi:hypothetical protein
VPSDSIDTDESAESGESTQGEVTPEASAQSPPGITAEQITDIGSQAQASGNQSILEAVQLLQQTLQQQQQDSAPPPPSGDELAERLLTDPKGTLRAEITEGLREQLAGPLARSFEIDRDERIEARAAEIDENWGEGFFDERIRPRLTGETGSLSHWPINQQADPTVIDSAINALLGNDFRDIEKAAEMAERLQKVAKSKAERDVATPPNMMGPGRVARPRTDKLSPDMKYLLEGAQREGVNITEKEIRQALTRENTLSAYLASQKETS